MQIILNGEQRSKEKNITKTQIKDSSSLFRVKLKKKTKKKRSQYEQQQKSKIQQWSAK